MSLTAEVEVGIVHLTGKVTIPVRNTLNKIVHPQGPTPIKMENNIADGFLNKKIKQKRSKAFDLKFHWMIDRIDQGQFWVYLQRGIDNLAD